MTLIWIHEDAMSLDHPVVAAAGETAEAVFIWDTDRHDAVEYALKRRMFIYECALDLGIPIYAGDTVSVLRSLAQGGTIYMASTPDPHIQRLSIDLKKTSEVIVIDEPSLVVIPDNTDTGRFFRFWNHAKKTALKPSPKNRSDAEPAKDTETL